MNTISSFDRGVTRLWWLPLLAGLLCIGLGIWTLCSPVFSMIVLAYVFTGFLIAAGVMDLCYGLVNARMAPNWGWSLALGLIELIAGIWMCTLPAGVLTVAFMYAVGIWIIIAAINSICEAFMLSEYSGWGIALGIIFLIATIFFAILFLGNPIVGGVVVWIWIAVSLICYGVYRICLAYFLRKITR